ncbi:MAG: hypothetical protein ACPGWR_18700 [Ardenticatenaceae bacterium]
MNKKEIKEAFDYIDNSGEYKCKLTYNSDDLLVYSAQANIKILTEPKQIVIDVNFYLNDNATVFLMFISKGYSGINSQLIDRLLLLINSMTRHGFFAYYQTGEIVFRHDLPTDYLDRQKIFDTLRNFEKVYVGVTPKLDSYALEWGLEYITPSEHKNLIKNLEWFFRGIERVLE